MSISRKPYQLRQKRAAKPENPPLGLPPAVLLLSLVPQRHVQEDIRVDAVGDACNTEALSAVAKIRGVNSMTMDGEKLTVVGDVDVVCVANSLRKAKFTAVVLSVGPEKEEKKTEEKKLEPKKPEPKKPPCCVGCSCPPPPPVTPWPCKVVY